MSCASLGPHKCTLLTHKQHPTYRLWHITFNIHGGELHYQRNGHLNKFSCSKTYILQYINYAFSDNYFLVLYCFLHPMFHKQTLLLLSLSNQSFFLLSLCFLVSHVYMIRTNFENVCSLIWQLLKCSQFVLINGVKTKCCRQQIPNMYSLFYCRIISRTNHTLPLWQMEWVVINIYKVMNDDWWLHYPIFYLAFAHL